MAGAVAKLLAKNVMKESVENKFGQEDPYFESVPATNLMGKKTTKKRKKATPEGLSSNDTKVLTKVKRRAYRLDLSLCNFCGIKFGWGSLIALVPALGDALDMALALMVVTSCTKIDGGLPANLRMQMLFNVVLDFVLGLVPFIGDLADAMYKCNTRNAVILENYLKQKARKNLRNVEDGNSRVTELEDIPRPEAHGGREEQTSSRPSTASVEPAQPQPARLPASQSHRNGRSESKAKRKQRG